MKSIVEIMKKNVINYWAPEGTKNPKALEMAAKKLTQIEAVQDEIRQAEDTLWALLQDAMVKRLT